MKRVPSMLIMVVAAFLTFSAPVRAQEASPADAVSVPAPVVLKNLGLLPETDAPCASLPSTAGYSVPGTNQGLCYNMSSITLCPNAASPFFGQDASYDAAPMAFTKTTISGGSYVYDSLGRYWAAPDMNRSWSDAQAYCASQTVMGSPLRLPTLLELSQLVDASRTTPAVNQTAFPTLQSGNYWTADAQGEVNAWAVNFAAGATQPLAKTSLAGTMCMSSMMLYSGGLVDFGDGTIADTTTSLMWEKTDSATGMSWDAALVSCAQTQTGGYTDWRLPTKNQLQSIITPASSTLWPSSFTAHAGAYWTATTLNDTPASAWVVLSDKQTNAAPKSNAHRVRCVRSLAPFPVEARQTIMSGTWTASVNGASVATRLVNVPRASEVFLGGQSQKTVIEMLSSEVTVAGSPSYSYHATGNAISGIPDFNVMLSHYGDTGGHTFLGMATGQGVSGTLKDSGQTTIATVAAARTAKPNTMQDFDISGLWTGAALGAQVSADIRSATYTSGGQTVAYFNGYLTVPYGTGMSPYSFTGFMESDGTVFMIRNTTTKVYIFEGLRSGNVITGNLRNYDQPVASNLVFTRIAGHNPQDGGVATVPYTLLFD